MSGSEITIKLRLFARLRELAGFKSKTFHAPENTSLAEFIISFAEQQNSLFQKLLLDPSDRRINSDYSIIVNNQVIDPPEMKRLVLQDGDEISVLPPASGG